MDLLFVGLFQNDSAIHQYIAFLFPGPPVAIAAGLALDRLIAALRMVTTPRLFPSVALVSACLIPAGSDGPAGGTSGRLSGDFGF